MFVWSWAQERNPGSSVCPVLLRSFPDWMSSELEGPAAEEGRYKGVWPLSLSLQRWSVDCVIWSGPRPCSVLYMPHLEAEQLVAQMGSGWRYCTSLRQCTQPLACKGLSSISFFSDLLSLSSCPHALPLSLWVSGPIQFGVSVINIFYLPFPIFNVVFCFPNRFPQLFFNQDTFLLFLNSDFNFFLQKAMDFFLFNEILFAKQIHVTQEACKTLFLVYTKNTRVCET